MEIKNLAFLTLLAVSSANCELIKTDLFSYANLASLNSKVDILISADIEPSEFMFFYNDEQKSSVTIDLFKKMLDVKGLYLFNSNDFYYVDKKPDDNDTALKEIEELRYVKLTNNVKDEVAMLLNAYDKNATYIKSDNAVSFTATDKIYNEVTRYLELFDKPLNQVKFKLTISETNLKNVKERGSQINSLLQGITRGDFKYYINLITSPYSSQTNVISAKSDGFYGVLSFLESNGVTKIVSSPFLTARSQTEVYFSSVQNIPYLVQNSQTSATQTTTQNSYEYKDVGLKIWITPIILDNSIDFSLHLIIEDMLSQDTLTPITSKKELKSSYTLKRGDILILSGINKTTNVKQRNGIPILKDIFLLQYLFSIEQDQEVNSVVTLTIEAI